MDFIIDTVGDTADPSITPNNEAFRSSNPIIEKLIDKYKDALEASYSEPTLKIKKEEKSEIEKFCEEMGWTGKKPIKKKITSGKHDIEAVLKQSVITPDFEKLHTIPPAHISDKKLKEERRKEREKTKGNKWYGLPATEMTDEVKNDLEVLQMRSVLDPKHFYKKNDLSVLPKYFQVGKVLDSPLNFYNDRLTKKERKRTLVDELLADAEFTKYNKRKYKEIIEENQKTHYKAYRKAKKLKRKNKK